MVKKVQKSSKKKVSNLPFYKTPYSRLPKKTKDLQEVDEKLLSCSISSLTRTHYIESLDSDNSDISIVEYSDCIDSLYNLIDGSSRWDLMSKFLLDIAQFKKCICYISVRKDSLNSISIIDTALYLSSMLRFYYKNVVNKARIHSKPLEDTCLFFAKHLHRMIKNSNIGLMYYRWKGVYTKAIKDDRDIKESMVHPNFNYLMDLVDMLEYNHMGVSFIGFKYKDKSSESSLFIPKGELLTHLISVCKDEPYTKENNKPRNTIIVRDSDKNIISIDSFDNLEEFIEVNENIMNKLNDTISEHTIDIDGIVLDGISFSRIFIDSSFDLCGRLFDRGEWTTLPKPKRKLLRIDGEKTLTADIKALHPSLLYREEGIVLPDDFDPYPKLNICVDTKDINKYCKYYNIEKYNPLRSVAKIALLVMLNSKSKQDAIKALRYKMIQDYQKAGTSKEDSMDYVGVPMVAVEEIINQVEVHNKPISHHFYTGVSKRLMRIDSDIIVETARLLLDDNIVLLPLHDSITVAESKIDKAVEYFRKGYIRVLGDDVNFRVEVE